MITKEEFFGFLKAFQTFDSGMDRFVEALSGNKYSISIYEMDWGNAVGKMLDTFVDSHFTEAGADWVNYYLFEPIKDKKVTVTLEGDMFRGPGVVEFHLNSIEELWEFLITDKKAYFKNAE